MTDLYPYSVESLEEMFSLRKGDINLLIKSEGLPFYSPLREQFIGYIPSLNSAFTIGHKNETYCTKNINLNNYITTTHNTIITLKSVKPSTPASSVLYNKKWVNFIKSNVDINDPNLHLLIPAKLNLPIFFGHKTAIERLKIGFTTDTITYSVPKFIKENN